MEQRSVLSGEIFFETKEGASHQTNEKQVYAQT